MGVNLDHNLNANNISFKYSHPLKTLYKKGKLPSVKYGFYGDLLKVDKVSLEHLKPKSKGGKSELSNYVLASRDKNSARGNDDIKNPEAAARYLDQFLDVNLPGLRGKKYIRLILMTLKKLGIDPSFYKKNKESSSSLDVMV